MIDFRYHVVSIIAVFLALTVGLVLGSSLFGRAVIDNLNQQVSNLDRRNQSLQSQISDGQQDVRFRDGFIKDITPALIAGKLSGRTVVEVNLPGSSGNLGANLASAVKSAGGTADGSVTVKSAMTQSANSAQLAGLVTAMLPVGAKVSGTTTQKAMAEIAGALTHRVPGGTGPATALTAESAKSILGAFKDAGFIDYNLDPALVPDLALAMAPDPPDNGADEQAYASYMTLIQAIDADDVGSVVAGDSAAASDGGLISDIRKDASASKTVSTVDSADMSVGPATVVSALVQEAQNTAGHYGSSGSDGPLPIPTTTP